MATYTPAQIKAIRARKANQAEGTTEKTETKTAAKAKFNPYKSESFKKAYREQIIREAVAAKIGRAAAMKRFAKQAVAA
jgi:hypothetical protein